MVKKGTYVRVEKTILEPEERTSKIPDDTKAVPFKMWTKGILQEDCEMNGQATIITMSGRKEVAKLVEVDPMYDLNYGQFIPELIEIDLGLKHEREN